MDVGEDPGLAAVIAAIPEWTGLEPQVTPITIGITNRNFKVDIGGEAFVVRLSGKDTDLLGIDRAAENEAASAAAAAGVAPEVFAYLPEQEALITRFVQGEHSEAIRDSPRRCGRRGTSRGSALRRGWLSPTG